MPDVKLLSNGNYHVMLTSAGSGYSRCKGVALTRWREDAVLDHCGTFCYLRDCVTGAVWSTSVQPTLQRPEACQTSFSAGSATFLRQDHEIETRTEIAVSLDDDVELRRVRITNLSQRSHSLSATSFAEIVMAAAATDSAHPAFSKLFVETGIDPALQAIFATRRPSTPDDPTLWLFHLALVSGSSAGNVEDVSYETDRMRFIGRGRSTVDPAALHGDAPLSGNAGPVLDAVAAIRVPFTLEAGASLAIDWITGIASSRDDCAALARKYRDARQSQRILEQTTTYRQDTLRRLQASDSDALLYERAAASILYADAALRADASVIQENRRGQPGLWGFGISGDLPVVLLQLTSSDQIKLVHQLVQAHAYWSAYGIRTELVVIGSPVGDDQLTFFNQIKQVVGSAPDAECLGKPGGIFVLDSSSLDDGDRILLQSVARMVISDTTGTLAQQLDRRDGAANAASAARAAAAAESKPTVITDASNNGVLIPDASTRPSPDDLLAYNGFGGFTQDAREYVITSSAARMTPAPWVNVLANPDFGTLVSESGSATTWSENAHEFRLTPWSNDAVGDANTEAVYIRDDATGRFWSPTLLPTRSAAPYVTRHGFGYSVFKHFEDGIESVLCIYVAIDAPVKFSVLKLHNRSDRRRRLSVTGYLDWVLGDERAKTLMHVVTELDTETGALFARNAYNTDFSGRFAFFDVDDSAAAVCGDRGDFFGHCGTLAAPAALAQVQLSGRVGAALDPCAALRVAFELAPGEEREIIFRLGVGKSLDEARDLVRRWRGNDAAHAALEAVHQYWRNTLGAVQVQTPDPTLNALANGWLIYQVIASRLWGRTAFYQSSGAFGFRDQLQDVMALVHAQPALVREHLLRAASRQFLEGDVQHWWHPPSGKGVRTRCSDDYLWLPLATCRYVETTGDTGVLDEPCHFLEGRLLKDGEQSNYELPKTSGQTASLYEHCVRSIRHGLRYGQHGLPLMGAGDWNDGMNLVGADGKGESVWLGFFLIAVLTRFAPLARQHADPAFADLCESEVSGLRQRIEEAGWDGAWYRRAWFDDGSPLGSAGNAECKIDSIAQSWAVLSNAADAERAWAAMNSVDQRLVHRDTRLIQLLDPPFDTSRPLPGYIQGYVPGVRENGGQYTHAAVWATMAFAALGDAERAWELLALLNPIRHGSSAEEVATFKVEPYVVAGDVYAFAPHAGRGGWTWYTGSAGWMYQLIIESLLGLRRSANKLRVSPLLPPHWKSLDIQYRFGDSHYSIHCRSGLKQEAAVVLDGKALDNAEIALVNDGRRHSVLINTHSGQAARKEGEKCK
jgi:cyclic beta-1,2-glucan synthetase